MRTSFTAGAGLHPSTDPKTSSAPFKARCGEDLVLRSMAGGSWSDMVAASDVNADDRRTLVDPDVFILPDGAVVMLVGCKRYYTDTTGVLGECNGDPLGRFEGDMADLTWPWSDAFA